MRMPSAPHVFLSYSRRNRDVMQRVVAWLREAGFNVWIDNEELTPGTPIWEAEIEGAIAAAGAAVVLLSPDAKKSEWVRAEVEYAKKNKKRVYPVLIAGDELTSVPLGLLSHQFVDLRRDERSGLEALVEALRTYLAALPGPEAPAYGTAGGAPGSPDWEGADRRRSPPRYVPQDDFGPAAQTPSWPRAPAAAPAAVAQSRGRGNLLGWVLGAIAVCVLGTCGVGAALMLPGLLAPGAPTPTPTSRPNITTPEQIFEPPADLATPTSPAESVELTLWHSYSSGSADEIALRTAIEQAAVDYPSIRVNLVEVLCGDILIQYTEAVAAGAGPDLINGSCINLGDAVSAGLAADLTDLASGRLDGYRRDALDGMSMDGRIYGIPERIYGPALWYNRAWLSEPPRDVDQLLALMEEGIPVGIDYSCYFIYGFYIAFGGQIFEEGGNVVADQYAGNVDALNYLSYLYSLSTANGWPTTIGEFSDPFTQGQIGAVINGNWSLQEYRDALQDSLGVAPLPAGPAGSARPLLGVNGYILNPNGASQEASLEVALDLTNPAAQAMMMDQVGIAPARTDVNVSDPLIADLLVAFDGGTSPILQYPWMNRYWGSFCSPEQVFTGALTPGEWLQSATAAANQ